MSNRRRPLLPHIVLDQNVLRDETIVRDALNSAKSNHGLVLISDSAFMEMTKSSKWEDTARGSLKYLSEAPELVASALSIPDLLRAEMDTGLPSSCILDHYVTPFLRDLLREVASGTTGTSFSRLKTTLPSVQKELPAKQLNHAQNRAWIEGFVNGWHEELNESQIKSLRQCGDMQTLVERMKPFLLDDALVARCSDFVKSDGSNAARDVSAYLAASPSIVSFHFLVYSAFGLKWLSRSGVPTSMPDDKLTNELVDAEYIILGLLCKELRSKETTVCAMFGLLDQVADYRWSWLQNALANAELNQNGISESSKSPA